MPAGVARWAGWRLVFDKPGRDGSAKANVVRAPAAAVWGALYRLDADEWPLLDRFEGGYERVRCRVDLATGDRREATTYVAAARSAAGAMADWYLAHLVRGAREHGLPPIWCEMLAALPSRPTDRTPRDTLHTGGGRR